MPADPSVNLYGNVVRITHVYLGPAADRFIARQVRNHLQKEPEELSPSDLLSLIDWIKVAVSFLADNPELVEEYTEELVKLTKAPAPKPSSATHG